MCEVLKVNVHPGHPDHLVITDEIEDLDINDINGITTAPLSFKEIDGQIYHLTPEVIYLINIQHPMINYYYPIVLISFNSVCSYLIQEIDFHCTPHPSKVAAGGKQTLTLPIVIFSDETSGNLSKKWNRLESYSFFLASLPREEVTKFSNIHFICVSNLVDSATLGKVIAEDLSSMCPMCD